MNSQQKKVFNIIITCFMIIYTIITITPFYFLFVSTFVPTKDSTKLHLWIPPAEKFNMDSKYGNMSVFYNLNLDEFKKEMGLKGYINPNSTMKDLSEKYKIPEKKFVDFLEPFLRYNGYFTIIKNGFLRSFIVTVIVTLTIIFVGGLLSAMTASVIAKFRKKWHERVYNLYLFSMIISAAVLMLPTYLIMTKYLHLYDNYMALILLGIQGGAIQTMIFTNYISTIPDALKESVDIDGGSRLQYFFKILLPNCKTPFAAFVAIMLPLNWNNLLNGILYLKPEHQTLMALLSTLNGTYTTNFQAIYSGLFLAILPLLIVYLFFQNLFVKSAMLGAVKG